MRGIQIPRNQPPNLSVCPQPRVFASLFKYILLYGNSCVEFLHIILAYLLLLFFEHKCMRYFGRQTWNTFTKILVSKGMLQKLVCSIEVGDKLVDVAV